MKDLGHCGYLLPTPTNAPVITSYLCWADQRLLCTPSESKVQGLLGCSLGLIQFSCVDPPLEYISAWGAVVKQLLSDNIGISWKIIKIDHHFTWRCTCCDYLCDSYKLTITAIFTFYQLNHFGSVWQLSVIICNKEKYSALNLDSLGALIQNNWFFKESAQKIWKKKMWSGSFINLHMYKNIYF